MYLFDSKVLKMSGTNWNLKYFLTESRTLKLTIFIWLNKQQGIQFFKKNFGGDATGISLPEELRNIRKNNNHALI